MKKPFWEEIYKKDDLSATFNSGQPSWDVIEVLEKHINHGRVLDLGCGDGRNSIYAAGKGFDVTAIDISEAGVSKAEKLAESAGLRIQTEVRDMRLFKAKSEFDVIISHGCLHLISRDEWPLVIQNMKAATRNNGYNIVVVFTDKIPPSEDMAPFAKGMFKEGELYDQYNDWTIITQQSHIFEDEHEGGIKHQHSVNRLIARKNTEA